MKYIAHALALLAVGITASSCDQACRNEQLGVVASPSGAKRAVVFNRNCGATTGFNTQVSIVRAGEDLSTEGGNALILEGSVPLKLTWKAESELSLTGVGGNPRFKQEEQVLGVKLSYE